MPPRTFLRAFLAIALLGSVSAGLAAEPVRLVSGPDYLPFTDLSLPNGGLVTELVTTAFEAAGMAATPVAFEPWKRGYTSTVDGRYDATFPYVWSAERDAEVLFSAPIITLEVIALFPPGSRRDYTGPESVAGLTLCLPLGYAADTSLQPFIDKGMIQVSQGMDPAHCLGQLAAGRVDFVTGPQLPLTAQIARDFNGRDPFVHGSRPIQANDQYLIVGRQNPRAAEILAAFNAGLKALHASGQWDEIVRRHMTARP